MVSEPDAYRIHTGRCADQIKTSGDVVVVICDADSSVRFYRYSDLSEITSHKTIFDKDEEELFTDIGAKGFDLYQNGNAYMVFYTAVKEIDEESNEYFLSMLELLFDPEID